MEVLVNRIAVRQPGAVIPVAMSVAALTTVLVHILASGAALAAFAPVYWLR